MGFDTIPAIPEDYSLYDWSDWQKSRDALAPGVKTKQFQIAAWNAIVDSLADAITAAGQTWDSAYTTAAGAKITVSDRKLYAAKFNSVRLNIDRQMHLDWPWAVRTDSRGYVGREDFQGRQDVGKACDKVYPEYILELVRKLNLLLDIMRGTGPIRYADTAQLIRALIDADAKSGIGARVDCRHNASTDILTSGARSGKSVRMAAASVPQTTRRTDVQPKAAIPVSCSHVIPSLLSASGRSRASAPAELEMPDIRSMAAADAMAIKRQNIAHISALRLSDTVSMPDAKTGESVLASMGCMTAHPSMDAEIRHAFPLHTAAARVSGSAAQAEPQKGLPRHVSANLTGNSAASAVLAKQKPARIECASRSVATVICPAVDTGWLTPKWVSGGLWIRQVHDDPVQRENGELEITGSQIAD